MIDSFKHYIFFLKEDFKCNKINSVSKYISYRIIDHERYRVCRYLFWLRSYEFFSKFWFLAPIVLLIRIKLYRVGISYNLKIEPNTVEYGLSISHLQGGVIINAAKVGPYCGFNSGVIIGNKGDQSNRPIIGSHCVFCMGAKVYGKISIGDNCIVGPNSVLFKDLDSNKVVAGNPAVIINNNSFKR